MHISHIKIFSFYILAACRRDKVLPSARSRSRQPSLLSRHHEVREVEHRKPLSSQRSRNARETWHVEPSSNSFNPDPISPPCLVTLAARGCLRRDGKIYLSSEHLTHHFLVNGFEIRETIRYHSIPRCCFCFELEQPCRLEFRGSGALGAASLTWPSAPWVVSTSCMLLPLYHVDSLLTSAVKACLATTRV